MFLFSLLHLLFLCISAASARHIHGRHVHKHVQRQHAITTTDLTEIPAPSTALPVLTTDPANVIATEILQIESCLDTLPADIVALILAIQQQSLSEVHTILASLLPTAPIPPPTVLPTAPVGPIGPLEPISDFPSPSWITGPTPVLYPPAIFTSSPSHVTHTRTTHVTHTITLLETVTFHMPIPIGALTHASRNMTTARNATMAYSRSDNRTISHPITSLPYQNSATPTAAINFTTITDFGSSSIFPTPSATPYVFNAAARDNLAVYYGQTPATYSGGLLAVCENSNVDIVILAFVYSFFSSNGYPSADFGSTSCSGQTDAQAQTAPGLQNCSALATQIASCQRSGKKVLVSLGGYVANTSISSDTQATSLATTLWNLFGAGTGEDPDLRPFGPDVVVDGFDIDNENGDPSHYETLALSLRQHYASDPSKKYYLSSAPQCPQPDASIPTGVFSLSDFVWVQFYNNPSCNLDSAGFQASFAAWSRSLPQGFTSTTGGPPRLYIGAGAWSGAGSGYVADSDLQSRISLARDLNVHNLGGIMLWDGSEALTRFDEYGNDYLNYAKWALQN